MTQQELNDYLLTFPSAWVDYPFGEETVVYKVGDKSSGNAKMFALIQDKSNPVRISLKCDPELAEVLRQQYESVLPGYHLSKRHWNTILCTGQLVDNEIKDLIRLSYDLVSGNKSD